MEFKAEVVGYRAEDGKVYSTQKEAREVSMKWVLMRVLMKLYNYKRQDIAIEHAEQLLELDDKCIITIDWDTVEDVVSVPENEVAEKVVDHG